MKVLRTTDRNFRYDFGKVYNNRMQFSDSVTKDVSDILDDVKRMGDQALFKYTEQFDAIELSTRTVEVTPKEIETALKNVNSKDMKALEKAAKRIEDFYKNDLQKSWQTKKQGVHLGMRFLPLDSVGIYVPGGKAAYPSSVLMTAIPAKVAGVQNIYMSSPWQKGEVNPHVIAASQIVGVKQIFKVGGAQAIAAMAYGTKSVPKVDKIVGPGNVYVTLAKKMVYGEVDIDMIAGPSEICILADGSVPPHYVASDMLAQAEHDEMACPLLVTNNSNYASRVEGEIRIQLSKLSRKSIASVAIQKRALIVLVKSLKEGIELINDTAPEHLEILVKNPEKYVDQIQNAGAIFIGPYTPETIGDYIAGPSHVLPTNGTAKYFSVLRASAFQRATSIVQFDDKALKKHGSKAIQLAEIEGLTAHAKAVQVRLDDL